MGVQPERASILELDPRVQLGLAAGLLMVAVGILALPWVEFDQALGGGTSLGFDDLRRAFGALDGNDRWLGNLLVWLAAGFFGFGYGIASLVSPNPTGSTREEQFLPAIPLALCLLMLSRINHFIADAAGVFLLSGVDARVGSGGIITTCGCAVVLGAVIWGHQLPEIADGRRIDDGGRVEATQTKRDIGGEKAPQRVIEKGQVARQGRVSGRY